MATPHIYSAIYEYLVRSYSYEELLDFCGEIEALTERNRARFISESVEISAKALINYCQYHGLVSDLIVALGNHYRNKKEYRKFRYTLEKITSIAVSTTPDLKPIIRYQSPPGVILLDDFVRGDDRTDYYVRLADILDRCKHHIVILGNPSSTDISLVELSCMFFWDLPTDFMLRATQQQEWCSKILSLKIEIQQQLPEVETCYYKDNLDLLWKYRDLLEERSQNAGLLPPSREPLRRRYRSAVVSILEEHSAQSAGTGFLALVEAQTPQVVLVTSADTIRKLKKARGDSVQFQCSTQEAEQLEAQLLYLPAETSTPSLRVEDKVSILELTPSSLQLLKVTPLHLQSNPAPLNWNCFCFGYRPGANPAGVEVNNISYELNRTDDGLIKLLEHGKDRVVSGAPLCRLHKGHDVIAGMIYVGADDKDAYLIPTDIILEIAASLTHQDLTDALPSPSVEPSPSPPEQTWATSAQTQPLERLRPSPPPDDLEIELEPAGPSFVATFTYTMPGQPNGKRLAQGVPVNFNLTMLYEASNDPSAYGAELTRQLFEDPKASAAWLEARSYAGRGGGGMRVRLRLDAHAAPLHAMRWETLVDPQNYNYPLAKNEKLLLSRYLEPDDLTVLALPAQAELRAAVVVASPLDSASFQRARLDVEAEVLRAQQALGGIPTTIVGAHPAARYSRATAEHLLAALRDGAQVLYLVCHGGTVPDQGPVLWLEGPDGSQECVRAAELAEMIKGLPERPMLAILLSCESAGNGYSPAPIALGPMLAMAGIPAVLGFQEQVAAKTVADLVGALLRELLERNGEIDRALAAARKVLRESWWQPVLWLGTRDGRVWAAPSG